MEHWDYNILVTIWNTPIKPKIGNHGMMAEALLEAIDEQCNNIDFDKLEIKSENGKDF